MRHIITLSTIPPRFAGIGHALKALVNQSSRPEAVELYIPKSYRRFPQWSGSLPEVPEGVRIVRVEEDLGPATKILPAAKAYRGQDVELLYVDDDRIFSRNWAKASLKLRQKLPGTALCGQAFLVSRYGFEWNGEPHLPRMLPVSPSVKLWRFFWRNTIKHAFPRNWNGVTMEAWPPTIGTAGYCDIAEGFCGVMVRPEFFDDAVFDIPPVVWAVDDVWLSGHLARRGIPIWADQKLVKITTMIEVDQIFPLHKAVLDGVGREEANHACIDHMRRTYGVWGGIATIST